ncbi:MAG: hypothetical protein M0C28_15630 [Candidatus Moduliflexus flocculans]|nr:hypothetical protein [Candidatus Moduliflexus flocculans]
MHPVRWNPADSTLAVLNELTHQGRIPEDPSVNLISDKTAASENLAMEIASRLVVSPEMVSPSGLATLVEPRDLTCTGST